MALMGLYTVSLLNEGTIQYKTKIRAEYHLVYDNIKMLQNLCHYQHFCKKLRGFCKEGMFN